MPTLPSIKKNDQVYVLSGKDRGKTGRVLIVKPAEGKIVVEGIQKIKRHTRANPQRNVKGGILEKESAINLSNVALVCKNCGKHTRIKHQVLADDRTVRTCKKCGTTID
jgi:large subunit ribosomal protein L24